MKDFKCAACGGERREPGHLEHWFSGRLRMNFTPLTAKRVTFALHFGAPVKVNVCRDCGFVNMHADLEKLDEIMDGGETRCRKCRYILKGLKDPRCPECGEPI